MFSATAAVRALTIDAPHGPCELTPCAHHDVGKIGVSIGCESDGAWLATTLSACAAVPPGGAQIVFGTTMFGRKVLLVGCYHERWDGKGRPEGLAGEERPHTARLVPIADCIEAILTERAYGADMPPRRCGGGALCRDAVRSRTDGVRWPVVLAQISRMKTTVRLYRDFLDGLRPTTTVGLSNEYITDREIGKRFL